MPLERYLVAGRLFVGRPIYLMNLMDDESDDETVAISVSMAHYTIPVGVPIPRARARGYEMRAAGPMMVIEDQCDGRGTRQFDIQMNEPGIAAYPAPRLIPHIDTRGVAIGILVREASVKVFSAGSDPDATDEFGSSEEE
eukprot:7377566-Prymnesium_polylepis.2